MAWYIDGIPLSTMAFNVSNRSAGWRAPSKRGENLVVPGRNGAQWLPNKSFEENNLEFNMWAIGADEDGSLPNDGDMRRKARENLDKLTALFGQTHKLLEIRHVTSNAFGLRNVMTNPGFEGLDTSYFTYQNSIVNPAMRRRAATTQFTNLFPNPSMVTGQATLWQQNYENLIQDPYSKWNRVATPGGSKANYWTTPSYESFAAAAVPPGWTTGGNITATVVATTAADQTANPNLGTKAFRIMTDVALPADSGIGFHNPAYMFPGANPTLRFRFRRIQNTTNARTLKVRLVTTDANDVAVTTGPFKTVTIPAYATWADFTYGFTDSAGLSVTGTAVNVRADFRCGEAWAIGDGLLIDGVMMADAEFTTGPFANTPPPYFDGDSAWCEWAGAAGNSVSRWYLNGDSRWAVTAPTATTSAYYAFTDRPYTDGAGTTLSFIAHGFNTTSTQTFTLTTVAPTALTPYTFRFNARGLSGGTAKVEWLKKSVGDAAPVVISTTNVVGAGTPVSTGSKMTGTFGSYLGESYMAQAGDIFTIRVTVPVRTDGNPSFQFSQIGLTDAATTFHGDSTNTVNSQFSWAGEVYNSKSIYKQRRIKRVVGRHAMVSTITPTGSSTPANTAELIVRADDDVSQLILENVALPASNQGLYVSVDVLGSMQNDGVLLGTANPTARMDVSLLDANGGTLNTVQTAVTSLNMMANNTGTFKTLSVRITDDAIPAQATQVRVTINIPTPKRAQGIHATDVVISPAGISPSSVGVPDYFDGSTPGAVWVSTPDDSASNYQIQFPTTWLVSTGIPFFDSSRLAAKSTGTNSVTSPRVEFAATLNVAHTAMPYIAGLEVSARAEDTSGNELAASYPVNVSLQFRSGATIVSTVAAGTISGHENNWKVLQGAFDVPATFSEVRVIFESQTAVPYALFAKIKSIYLTPDSTAYTVTIPRVNWNGVDNSSFQNDLEFWRYEGVAPTIIDSVKGKAASLGSNTVLMTNDIPIAAGQGLQLQNWSRKAGSGVVQPSVRWCRITRRNLAPNPSFTVTTSMTTGGSSTNTISTAWALNGTTSVQNTATGTGSTACYPYGVSGAMGRMGVVPGGSYMYSASIRLAAPQTGTLDTQARKICIGVTQAGVTNFTFATSAQAANVAGVTRLSVAFTVPADAENVFVRLMNGSQVSGESVWWDSALLETGSVLGTYFDADTTDTASVWYRWASDEVAPMSASEMVTYSLTADTPVTQTSYAAVDETVLTAPASTTFAVYQFSGAGAEVSFAYAGIDFARHDTPGYYDALTYAYFDGSSSGDLFGQPTAWVNNSADNAISRVMPQLPLGWVNNLSSNGANIHVDDNSTYRPPGSVGRVGMLPRLEKGTTRNYRTQGILAGGASFLSGEIAINHYFGLTVTVQVYGSANATGSGPLLFSKVVTDRSGEIVSWRDIPLSTEYFYLQIVYTDPYNRSGYPVRLDNLLMIPSTARLGADYPGFFDGSTNGGAWEGPINNSASQYYGGGRRAYVEVTDAIDFTSMAGGTRAEFSVGMTIPSAFWEDLIQSTSVHTISNANLIAGFDFTVDPFNGSTAPIDDALITIGVTGSVSNLTLVDTASGATLTISGTIPNNLVIDNSLFTVKAGNTSYIANVTRKKSNQLLPLTPTSSTAPPKLNIKASGSGSVTVTIVARRRYLVA